MEKTRIRKASARQIPEPADELKQLQLFVGKWLIQGQNLEAAPYTANAEIAGVQTYEWLPGNFFLVEKWDRQFDDTENIGIGMFSYDLTKRELSLTNYDNLGLKRVYHVDSYKNTWKYSGDQERATIVFSMDGFSFIEDWEILKDFRWQPLCTWKGTKIK